MSHGAMVNLRGEQIKFTISAPKQDLFPLLTARADGMCYVETQPVQRWVPTDVAGVRYTMQTTVYQSRISWRYFEPAFNAVRPYEPDQPPIVLDPAVLETSDPDEARGQHAYLVDCIDLGLLRAFERQEVGVEGKIANSFRWALPGVKRPLRAPGGGMLCPYCRGRLVAEWGEHRYCSHCGTCLWVSSEL